MQSVHSLFFLRSLCAAGMYCCLLAGGLAPLGAQGRTDYFNVESPLVEPMAIASVAGEEYLLVCNTPDNSLEVYSTDETVPIDGRFVARIPVGLEPVSVVFDNGRFFTANFLGDSVTTGELGLVNGVFRFFVDQTRNVGDEPIALETIDLDGQPALAVSLNSASAIGLYEAVTLEPIDSDFSNLLIDLVQSTGQPPLAINQPRTLLAHDGQLAVLGFRGGVTHPNSLYDLDLVRTSIALPLNFDRSLGGLGSTNFNATVASNGDLYVVGGEAQNFDTESAVEVREQAAGSVISTLYRIEEFFGEEEPVTFRRDVHQTAFPEGTIVPKSEAVAMPTDLALMEENGAVAKLFVAGFGSDRIGIFEPPIDPTTNPHVSEWNRRVLDYATESPIGGSQRWGPRDLLLHRGTDLYVLNRLDHSITLFDAVTELEVGSFSLQQDPTPSWVVEGRPFLYNADLSGNGFVSCASCHPDGRTDGLVWRLGNPEAIDPTSPEPRELSVFPLVDAVAGNPASFVVDMLETNRSDPDGEDDKRELVTQTLQGLLSFEVPPAAIELMDGAPFHWRGDRAAFTDFNEAFVTLQLSEDVGELGDPKGITDEEMKRFEEFAFSIQLPPNPQQPLDRVYSDGDTGGLTGMNLFHTVPLSEGQGRSCIQCHELPTGSNDRITQIVNSSPSPGYTTLPTTQGFLTGPMRGIAQREGLLERDGQVEMQFEVTPRIGHFGLSHNGTRNTFDTEVPELLNPPLSINTFVDTAALNFAADFPTGVRTPEMLALKQFVHEFDSGAAPTIGLTQTFDPGNLNSPVVLERSAMLLDQAKVANVGVAIQAQLAGVLRGFWLDGSSGQFVEEPNGNRFDFGGLLELVVGPRDRLTMIGTPLGSERRIGSPTGVANQPFAPAPTSLSLLPTRPSTANLTVPSLTNNWTPPDAAPPFTPPIDEAFVFDGNRRTPFLTAMRLFQYGLIEAENDYGLDGPRHEAPRRLRVTGEGIRTGAQLVLSIPDPPADWTGIDPVDAVLKGDFPTLSIELPIHPTNERFQGETIWETAVEVAPFELYQLLLGWRGAPGVRRTIDYTNCSGFAVCGQFGLPDPEPVLEPTVDSPVFESPFDPDRWNWHYVEVRNPGGAMGDGGWQQLTLSRE